jgi:S-adenosylmethionine:tRNA ribosyltransferase-isomerase
MHEPGTSHFGLLEAFARRPYLDRALEHARVRGYLAHEFGDSLFIAPPAQALAALDSPRAAPFPG